MRYSDRRENLLFLLSSSILAAGCLPPRPTATTDANSSAAEGSTGTMSTTGGSSSPTSGISGLGTMSEGTDGTANESGTSGTSSTSGTTFLPGTASSDTGSSTSRETAAEDTGSTIDSLCADFGAKYVECYAESGWEAICHDYYAFYSGYGQDCSDAFNDFFVCATALECSDFGNRWSVCGSEYDALMETCFG